MIDFTEVKNGEEWELFARDFLKLLGFDIVLPPSRGADGGRDIMAIETVNGINSVHKTKWLVSCKNFAVSNNSVNESRDELNILERVKGFNANGFMGFYSTLASSGLVNRLECLSKTRKFKRIAFMTVN